MAKKDPELAKLEAERNAKEAKTILDRLQEKLKKVPATVITGSVQTAIAWKKCASKAHSLLNAKRPALKTLREVSMELDRY